MTLGGATDFAIALYYPNDELNVNQTHVIEKSGNELTKTLSEDRRVMSFFHFSWPDYYNKLSVFTYLSGFRSPDKVGNGFEAISQRVYVLFGTPNEIASAVAAFDAQYPALTFSPAAADFGTEEIPFEPEAGISAPVSPTVSLPPAAHDHTEFCTLTRNLARGASGDDVLCLQHFLQHAGLLTEADIVGTYGPRTERAVGEWQIRNSIVTRGAPGYGNVGPKTRAALNAAMSSAQVSSSDGVDNESAAHTHSQTAAAAEAWGW